MPTLGESIERAKYYGYTLRRIVNVFNETAGVPEVMEYLWRESDRRIVNIEPMHKDVSLPRGTVESLCKRSGIPLDDFFGEDDFFVGPTR
jgi:hypothetical protein